MPVCLAEGEVTLVMMPDCITFFIELVRQVRFLSWASGMIRWSIILELRNLRLLISGRRLTFSLLLCLRSLGTGIMAMGIQVF